MPNPRKPELSLWQRARKDRWWFAAAVLTAVFALVTVGYGAWTLWTYARSARVQPGVVLTMPEDAVRSAVARLVAAELPADAADVYGQLVVYSTTIFHVRFATNERDLADFLKSSPALPNLLIPGQRPLTTPEGPPLGWWRPDDLNAVAGVVCAWPAAEDQVACRVMSGRRGDRITVYMQFTIERGPRG